MISFLFLLGTGIPGVHHRKMLEKQFLIQAKLLGLLNDIILFSQKDKEKEGLEN